MSLENTKRLCRKYNDGLLARGVTDKEWYVNSEGDLRMRFKMSGQHRFDLGEQR